MCGPRQLFLLPVWPSDAKMMDTPGLYVLFHCMNIFTIYKYLQNKTSRNPYTYKAFSKTGPLPQRPSPVPDGRLA